MLVDTEAFRCTEQCLDTNALRTGTLTHRNLYTKHLLHRAVFIHRGLYTPPLHTDVFAQKSSTPKQNYTQKLLHTEAFTQEFLHREAFPHRSFDPQKRLHRKALTQKSFSHTNFLHTEVLHRQAFYTQKSFHR